MRLLHPICFLTAVIAIRAAVVQDKEWSLYKKEYGKSYDEGEDMKRYKIYLATKKEIEEHNKLYEAGMESYALGINQFTDMEAFEVIGSPLNINLAETNESIPETSFDEFAIVPRSLNWKDEGKVTLVKNQSLCESCWAFAAVGAIESQHAIKTNVLNTFSEQQLIDCDKSNDGCKGGWPHKAFAYLAKTAGINTAKSYPNTNKEGKCKYRPKKDLIGAKIKSYLNVHKNPPSEDALMKAVALKGPVTAAINADSKMKNYKKGIYNGSCQNAMDTVNHAVLVVGYGTGTGKDLGKDYWIIKNSWGPRWGENGYIRIPRNKGNKCGIALFNQLPVLA